MLTVLNGKAVDHGCLLLVCGIVVAIDPDRFNVHIARRPPAIIQSRDSEGFDGVAAPLHTAMEMSLPAGLIETGFVGQQFDSCLAVVSQQPLSSWRAHLRSGRE